MKGFFKNWELKMLALLSAIVLWFFVVGIENNSYRFSEEIEIQALNLPADMSLANEPGKAKVRIRADESLIKNLKATDFDLSIDLKKAKEGAQDLPVTATSKNDKVTVLKVDPATVHIVLEPLMEKDIKVKAVVSGKPAKGHGVENVQVTPATVKVKGGKTLLASLSSINAEVKLDGTESTNFKQTVMLKLPETLSQQNVKLNPEQATVEVSIQDELEQKTVPVKADLQGNYDLTILSLKVVISPETVTIQGKPAALDAITEVKTEPVLFEKLKNATTPVKAKLILPSGISIPDSQPNAVMISLTAP